MGEVWGALCEYLDENWSYYAMPSSEYFQSNSILENHKVMNKYESILTRHVTTAFPDIILINSSSISQNI